MMVWCAMVSAQAIYTVAGLPRSHRMDVDGMPALNAALSGVYGLLFDKLTGRLLLHDGALVERLEPDGSLLTLVGNGEYQDGSIADGTFASNLQTGVLRGMAQDAAGNLYLADAGLGRIFRVTPDGIVSTFAGGGDKDPGFQSDGGPAAAARMASPRGMVFDSKGNLDIAEIFCNCIRRVSPAGIISTVYTLPAKLANGFPQQVEGLAIDGQDSLYVTEWMGHTVLKIGTDGSATTLAGTGVAGFSGDGGPASAAQLNGPSGVRVAPDGDIYIADTLNNRVRKVGADGTISTVAGGGSAPGFRGCGFSGDGGPVANAQLCDPAQILLDSSGNWYIADFGNARVRRISPDGIIATVAGNGQYIGPSQSIGDGGPALYATFYFLAGAAFDRQGNLYASDLVENRIRKIAPDGTISTFEANTLLEPGPLATDANGNLYVMTLSDSRIWRITPVGIVSLVAGTGTGTGLIRSQGDGGPAVNATLNLPQAVAIDAQGNIYVADTSNARLRKIDTLGIINTVAGPGQLGVDYYDTVAIDPQGKVYFVVAHYDPANGVFYSVVNRLNPDTSVTRVAGSGESCINFANGNAEEEFPSDGLPATQARLCAVTGMAIDSHGIMYLSDGEYMVELRVNSDGTIQRVAGSTFAFPFGDGGPAVQASLKGQDWSPGAATFDPNGNLFLPQTGTSRIREVTTTPYTITLSPDHIGWVGPQTQSWSLATTANFAEPSPYAVRVTTSNGGSWLTTNRVTGVVGEPITVTINPAGLANGFYQGTVSVVLGGGPGHQVDLPVALFLPSPGK
jgi:sugar lactone lactonase YvrE